MQAGDDSSLLEVIAVEVLKVAQFWIYIEDRTNRIVMDWIWV